MFVLDKNVCCFWCFAFLAGGSSSSSSSPSKKKKKGGKAVDPKLAKYVRMKAMGMPDHAIINKMRLDGMEKSMIHKFEILDFDEEEDSEEDEVDLNVPELAKYHRMKKMMPSHAIANKMKMDGIDGKIIAAFCGGNGSGTSSATTRKLQKQRSIAMKPRITPNVNMKRFHWQTVDYAAAKDSIWRTMDERSVTDNLNVAEFEGLFCIPQRAPPQNGRS